MKIKVGDQVDVDGVRLTVNALSAVSVSLLQVETGLTKEILISEFVRLPEVKPVATGACNPGPRSRSPSIP